MLPSFSRPESSSIAASTVETPIPGLSLTPGRIGTAEESELLERVDEDVWRHDLKRRVQHYGFRYDYRARSVSAADDLGPLPSWLSAFAARLADKGVFPLPPDQVIVNEYLPGQGISPHIDCVPCFGGTIAVLSLGCTVTMSFQWVANED